MLKLNLGCGTNSFKGFTNVDIRDVRGVDVIDDVGKLASFKSNTVDLIYACHVLEHFGRHDYMKVLERWYNVLNDGGKVRISVPDIGKVCHQYSTGGVPLKKFIGFLYGGQTYKENYHYIGFDMISLTSDLKTVGFTDVYEWDWRKTEHSDVDDFSQAYIPHMDKDNGILMSLNVEAKK